MKTTVIYHSADYDGLFCREIARKFLPKDAELIGWNFGDPPVKREGREGLVYVMDLPVDAALGLTNPNWIDACLEYGLGIIWIDHHKTSIETHPKDIPGYRIDGVAACRLAWQWFALMQERREFRQEMPLKEHFVNRSVLEPLAVRLAGEYDIWDKRDPRAETFQYGLRCAEVDSPLRQDARYRNELGDKPWWDFLLDTEHTDVTNELLQRGAFAQVYAQRVDASICNALTWLLEWEGLKFLCVNHARFNSLLFAAKDVPGAGHDALLGFRFDGKKWMVSLYHAKHRTELDLSEIAKKYGGGGHRGACGFTCERLPFL